MAAAALAMLCVPARAEEVPETALKTAYVYNFIVLSTWPVQTPPVLRFCTAGSTADTNAFKALGGKAARERTISVANVATPDRTGECHILYIPAAETKRLGTWLAAVANQPTLTISDQSDAQGAIVNLRRLGHQIVFDLDTRAAAAARIQLSSQLLKLAASRK